MSKTSPGIVKRDRPEGVNEHRDVNGSRDRTRRHWWIWPAFVAVIAVRVAATSGDLALDEIWSLWFVKNVLRNAIQVIALRHDNNHILNTLMMYGLGPDLPGICYRVLPAIASVASVYLAVRITVRRTSDLAPAITWILVGASYPLILYGTEARGYSFAIFLAFLSWLFLLRTEANGRWIDAFGFAISASLGFLAHLTFLYCYGGYCVWTFLKVLKKRSWILCLAHLLPAATAMFLYLFFIRGMAIGGGPESNVVTEVTSTMSIATGGPLGGAGSLAAAGVLLAVLGTCFYQVGRVDRATAFCYLSIIVLVPAFVLAVTLGLLTNSRVEICPRYFLIPIAFALLLICEAIPRWWNSGKFGRTCQVGFICIYVTGNCWWTAGLLNHGRGDYSNALQWMAKNGTDSQMTLSTDHDFRNRMLFEYYTERLWPGGSPLKYVDRTSRSMGGTDWVILHNFNDQPANPNPITDASGNQYELKGTWLHHSLTGWNWWVYRKTTRTAEKRSGSN